MLALSITMVACGEKNNDEPAPIEPTMTNIRLNVTVVDYSPAPGQFVNLTVEGLYLRRPISVFDWDETTITIIYKVVGEGTEKMAQWPVGYKCDVLTGLGNGFDMSKSSDEPVLIGGGVVCAEVKFFSIVIVVVNAVLTKLSTCILNFIAFYSYCICKTCDCAVFSLCYFAAAGALLTAVAVA